MAVKIEALSDLSVEEQSEILEKMATFCLEGKGWKNLDAVNMGKEIVDIEVDGVMYSVPKAVNELLNSIYRMYEKELLMNKKIDGGHG